MDHVRRHAAGAFAWLRTAALFPRTRAPAIDLRTFVAVEGSRSVAVGGHGMQAGDCRQPAASCPYRFLERRFSPAPAVKMAGDQLHRPGVAWTDVSADPI